MINCLHFIIIKSVCVENNVLEKNIFKLNRLSVKFFRLIFKVKN
jgi:hypothetical protein